MSKSRLQHSILIKNLPYESEESDLRDVRKVWHFESVGVTIDTDDCNRGISREQRSARAFQGLSVQEVQTRSVIRRMGAERHFQDIEEERTRG